MEKSVRDGNISKQDAMTELKRLHPLLKSYFKKNNGVEISRADWIFPVEGYGPSVIGGSHGEGYRPEHYDFFDGNKHGGHPAHDIFVYDRNQDIIDDKTGKPVNILSMSSGWVVSISTGWQQDSEIRGGNYIWIYDTVSDGLFYYAHLAGVLVNTGQVVTAGEKIAELGRSGKNAFPSRSPTHLHLMYLKYQKDGNLIPEDLYTDLCKPDLAEK